MKQRLTKEDPTFKRLFELRPRKGDLKKLEMILVATRQLAKYGLAGFNLDSVAKELGVRRSHVAYYFKTQNELIHEVIGLVIATGQDVTIGYLE